MKIYKKQIDHAKEINQQQQQQQQSEPREPRTPDPNRDARVKFMQNIVRDARVRQ